MGIILLFCAVSAAEIKESGLETAVFSGGFFWKLEDSFSHLKGVKQTEVGFMGGSSATSYAEVEKGKTNHVEVVRVQFSPKEISYDKLVRHFFTLHNPTLDVVSLKKPFHQSILFFSNPFQQNISQKILDQMKKSNTYKKPILTQILPVTQFFRAEEYLQHYLEKNKENTKQEALIPAF